MIKILHFLVTIQKIKQWPSKQFSNNSHDPWISKQKDNQNFNLFMTLKNIKKNSK